MAPPPPPPPRCGCSPGELSSVPDDIALNIASSLEASDACSLGSCSRFWRVICASDCVWAALAKRRWPPSASTSSSSAGDQSSSPAQGWREYYISKHIKLAHHASAVVRFVEDCSQSGSLEVGNYLKAISALRSSELGFKDVQLFMLAQRQCVVLNLIGLHYSITWLGVPPNEIIEALHSCQVMERRVCVTWLKLGRWFYGFRLPDENRSRKFSLGELAMNKEKEVLSVLTRGAVHEVFRVHITSTNTDAPTKSPV